MSDPEAVRHMVEGAVAQWGRVDILVNNAGVLRDKSFAKMSLEDFRFVLEVHLMGAVNCCKAVWDLMREQNYGRIVMTTSASGLYGNFGQSNYAAAKMGLVGLMQTLALEGAKHDIRVNSLAPVAATRMTEGVIQDEVHKLLKPEDATAGLLYLVSEAAPNRTILGVSAGTFAPAYVTLTQGVFLPQATPEQVHGAFESISDPAMQTVPIGAGDQIRLPMEQFQRHNAHVIASKTTS